MNGFILLLGLAALALIVFVVVLERRDRAEYKRHLNSPERRMRQ